MKLKALEPHPQQVKEIRGIVFTNLKKAIPPEIYEAIDEVELTELTIQAKLTVYFEIDLKEDEA